MIPRIACATAAVVAVAGQVPIYGWRPNDLRIYLRAGDLARAGQSPLLEPEWLYPPGSLALYALPPEVAVAGHWLLTLGAAAYLGALLGRAAGKWWLVAVVALLVLPPMRSAGYFGNAGLWVAGLTAAGCRGRRPWIAGVLVGAAAACKLVPALALVAWWRSPDRWKVWGMALAVGLASLFLPGGWEWLAAGGPLVAVAHGPEIAGVALSVPLWLRGAAAVIAVALCLQGPLWGPWGVSVAALATGFPWGHAFCGLAAPPTSEQSK